MIVNTQTIILIMRSTFSILSLSFCALLMVSCEYFETTTHTPQQIKKASAWSDADQVPSFEGCQDLESSEQFDCFKNTLRTSLEEGLYAEPLVSNQEIDREIILTLLVDTDGAIRLTDTEGASGVFDAVVDLENILTNAVAQLPLALPATKTNVGVKVKTSIKVPIRIIATPQT